MKRITALTLLLSAGDTLSVPFPTGDPQAEHNPGAYLNQHYYKFK